MEMSILLVEPPDGSSLRTTSTLAVLTMLCSIDYFLVQGDSAQAAGCSQGSFLQPTSMPPSALSCSIAAASLRAPPSPWMPLQPTQPPLPTIDHVSSRKAPACGFGALDASGVTLTTNGVVGSWNCVTSSTQIVPSCASLATIALPSCLVLDAARAKGAVAVNIETAPWHPTSPGAAVAALPPPLRGAAAAAAPPFNHRSHLPALCA